MLTLLLLPVVSWPLGTEEMMFISVVAVLVLNLRARAGFLTNFGRADSNVYATRNVVLLFGGKLLGVLYQ